jgi:hypothetical protein
MEDKSQLIASLRTEFEQWEAFLERLSPEQISAPNRIESLSIKDILAHLTTWQVISVARFEAALQGVEMVMPAWHPNFDTESDDDLDQINAWIFENSKNKTWAEVRTEWRERYLRLLELCEGIQSNDLFDPKKYPWMMGYPLAAVLTGTLEHHVEHREPLLAMLK